jgi:hypothetical protein
MLIEIFPVVGSMVVAILLIAMIFEFVITFHLMKNISFGTKVFNEATCFRQRLRISCFQLLRLS